MRPKTSGFNYKFKEINIANKDVIKSKSFKYQNKSSNATALDNNKKVKKNSSSKLNNISNIHKSVENLKNIQISKLRPKSSMSKNENLFIYTSHLDKAISISNVKFDTTKQAIYSKYSKDNYFNKYIDSKFDNSNVFKIFKSKNDGKKLYLDKETNIHNGNRDNILKDQLMKEKNFFEGLIKIEYYKSMDKIN